MLLNSYHSIMRLSFSYQSYKDHMTLQKCRLDEKAHAKAVFINNIPIDTVPLKS